MPSLMTAPFRARTWRETAYALVSLATGVFWFTAIVVLWAVGIGSLIGVALIPLALYVAKLGGTLERQLLGWATGTSIPEPPVAHVPDDASFWQRWRPVLLNVARLRESAYLLLLLPTGVILFSVAVTWWFVALLGIVAPVGSLWDATFLWDDNRLDTGWEWTGTIAVAAFAFFTAPWVVRGVVRVQASLGRALLGPTRGQLEKARAAAVATVSRDRRQIERDLHDGAQARLVALAVDLGRARERLEEGAPVAEAAELVRDAHEDAKRALEEVRNLARGIHPAILTDRGLDAALSSLAAKSPVPVYLDSDPAARAPEAVEAAAYFVVSEALANVARHSGATRAEVKVAREDSTLVVRVEDDGKGGAAGTDGSGLSGLAERVRSLEGTFDVVSPPGRGTTLIARFPCG